MYTTTFYKRFVYLCLCILLPALSHGQLINSIAIKAGGSIANQDWKYKRTLSDPYGRHPITGAFGGLELEFLKGRTLGLSAELSYCQKGFKKDVPVTTSDQPDGNGSFVSVDNRYNYFSFSPFLTVNHERKNWSAYVGLGPRIDFFSSRTIDQRKTSNQDIAFSIIGVTASGGVSYKLGNMAIFTELKFLYDAGHAIDTEFVQVHNRAAVLCFGLRQRFTK